MSRAVLGRAYYITLALIYFILTCYGYSAYRKERFIENHTELTLRTKHIIVSATLGCLVATVATIIISIASSASISGLDLPLIGRVGGLLGATLVGYSFVNFAGLAIKAVTLAEDGIAGTRKKWFQMLEKYNWFGWMILLVVFVVSALFAAHTFQYIVGSLLILIGIAFGLVAHKLRSISKGTSTKECIAQTCRQMYWVSASNAIACIAASVLWISWGTGTIEVIVFHAIIFGTGPISSFILIRFIATTNTHHEEEIRTQPQTMHALVGNLNHAAPAAPTIEMVRRQSMKDFTTAHTFKRLFRTDVCSLERFGEDQI